MEHSTKTIHNINSMYRRTTKHQTNVNERHNALNASDHQAFEILQAVLLYSFVQQHHAHQLLLASVVLDFHEDEDDTIFLIECPGRLFHFPNSTLDCDWNINRNPVYCVRVDWITYF